MHSRNSEGLSFSEKFILAEDVSKNSIYKTKLNNGVGNMGLSEPQKKVTKVLDSIDLEKHFDENMIGLQSFNEQEPRIENR